MILPITSPSILNGAIVVQGEKILDAGTRSDILSRFKNAEIVELGERIIMPGLVNAHTHITLSDAQEANTGKQFPEWLQDLIAYRRPLTSEDHARSATSGLSELLRMGTTTIGDSDFTLTPLEVALKNNFRGMFFFEVFGLSAPIQFWEIRKYQQKLKKGRSNESAKSKLGISPHTVYTVTPPVMRFASKYASRHNLQLSMHVSENAGEIEFLASREGIYRKTFAPYERKIPVAGLTPLMYADTYNLVNERFLCAHGVHLTDVEFKLLGKRNGSLVSCPSSNRNLGSGILDIRKPLNAGVNTCIGTDSPASGDGYDLFHELRLSLKIGTSDEIKINPADALRMITINPAKAIGMGNDVGSIEAGKSADFITLELPHTDFSVDKIHEEIIRTTLGDNVVLTIASGIIRYSVLPDIPVEKSVF